jgi:hypothetical protein
MRGVPLPQQEKHRFFSVKQSMLRKDVECAFCQLKKMFNILAIPDQSYSQHSLGLIMCTYIIWHNTIIDDERAGSFDKNYHIVTSVVATLVNYEVPASLTSILQIEVELISGLMFLNL